MAKLTVPDNPKPFIPQPQSPFMRIPSKPTAILMAAALLGTAILYGIVVMSSSPDRIPLQNIDASMDGRYITTEGMLADAGAPSYTHLVLRDNGAELAVVLDPGVNPITSLTPGDVLEVTGEVEIYGGKTELRVMSRSGLSVLERAGDSELPVSLILSDPERFSGTYLRTSGNLSSVHVYRDNSRLLMRCRTGDIWLHSDSGDIERPEEFIQVQVTVCGQVEFNGLMDRYEILINTTDVFNGSGGGAVSVSDILAGNVSEGTEVCITGFPDMGLYESTGYGVITNGSRSLSIVAYGDLSDELQSLEGEEISAYGILRYGTYSGTWRLVLSAVKS